MQYPVPQFTDVEDKIIGPLTIKQFGIIFAVGMIMFLGFSATKSILVLVFLFIIVGIPGLGLAFAKLNGRPVYNSIGNFVKFVSSPKVLIFHKEPHTSKTVGKMSDSPSSPVVVKTEVSVPQDPQAHLKEIQELLRKTASQESDVANKMK